jgi:hypothetical protein
MRATALVVFVAACVTKPDYPGLFVGATSDSLEVTLVRGPEHTFGTVKATVNGVDCGAPDITPGMPASIDMPEVPARNASASFAIGLDQVGADAHVKVSDGGDEFEADAPTVGLPRQLQILSSLAAPLHAGDWIEAASGVDTDTLLGGFTLSIGSQTCAGLGDHRIDPGSIGLQVPTDLAQRWMCGTPPAPGSQLQATLTVTLWPAGLMTCIRPKVTMCAAGLPTLTSTATVAVQF